MHPKPIMRSASLVQFSKDHHFALLLIWKIRQGLRFEVEPLRISKYINFFFNNYLEEHFKEEEELLFVHLDKNQDIRKTAEEDHKTLRKFADIFPSKTDTSLIYEFANKLEAHIRFEERTLFAFLQKALSETELKFIGDKMESFSQNQIADNWDDEFWIKKTLADNKHIIS